MNGIGEARRRPVDRRPRLGLEILLADVADHADDLVGSLVVPRDDDALADRILAGKYFCRERLVDDDAP